MARPRDELNDPTHKKNALGSRAPSKCTPEVMDAYVAHIRKTGRKHEAAAVAGVSYDTLRMYVNKNMFQLADRVEEAMSDYREAIESEIHRRAIEGVAEPIIGGKDRDEIVTYVQRYSDRLLEFHAKRHIPEYRQTQQIDMNVRGGVIAVPAQATTIEGWAEVAAQVVLPAPQDPDGPATTARPTPSPGLDLDEED